MSRPYAVVLDYFGTLTPPIPRADLRRSVDRVAAALDIDPELFHALFVQSWPERSRGELGGTAATIRSLVERSGRAVDDVRLAEATAVRLAEYRHLSRPRPEAAAVIDALKDGGARIGVASDCGSELVELWNGLPLARLVDAAVFSWELGAAKPAVGMFQEIARRLDLQPEACLYVGDGGADELSGAARAGMTPVWLRDQAAHDASIYGFVGGDAATRVVENLAEVVEILDGPSSMA